MLYKQKTCCQKQRVRIVAVHDYVTHLFTTLLGEEKDPTIITVASFEIGAENSFGFIVYTFVVLTFRLILHIVKR
jgi:hypothetical protein